MPTPLQPLLLVVGAVVGGQLLSAVKTGNLIPWPVVVNGAVSGISGALLVVGLVLVFRAARIINFAHTAIGYVGLVLYLLLRTTWGWNFWLAVPSVLVVSAVLGVAIEVGIVRRFANAPRLVLTVVTIALAQFLVALALLLVPAFGYAPDDDLPAIPPDLPLADISIRWGPQIFGFAAIATIAAGSVALVSLALFFRRSTTGVAIRGAAENRSRAGLLGINVNNLSAVVWGIAAALAAIGSLLHGMIDQASLLGTAGSAAGASFAGGVLMRAIAAAILARMDRLWVAVGAAIAISIVDQAVFWSFRQTALLDAVLLGIIVVALLLQRKSLSRTDIGTSGTWEAAEELQPIPSALRNLPTVRRTARRAFVAVAAVLLGFPWVMSPSQTVEGSLFAIYGIIAVSLVVLTGWGGQISLGQFGFVAVGAMAGGYLTAQLGLPFPVALLATMAIGAAVAIVVGLPALRIQGLFLAVTTLGFAVVAQTVLLDDRWFDGFIADRVGRPVFFGIDMNDDERGFYYLCLAGLGLAVAVAVALRRTRTGRVLMAMRDNERAAQSFGISLVRTRLVTFAIAGSLSSLAGALFANHQFAVSQTAFGPDQSISVFLMAVMGGLGSVYGVLLGVLYFGFARIVLPGAGSQLLASAVGVLLVLAIFPGGLGSIAYRLRDAWLRRVATRHRIFVPSLFGVERHDADLDLVRLAPRPDDAEEIPRIYSLDSDVATAGASQRAGAWRA